VRVRAAAAAVASAVASAILALTKDARGVDLEVSGVPGDDVGLPQRHEAVVLLVHVCTTARAQTPAAAASEVSS